ncbi:MAG: hypothetical protein E7491_02585 [Ruminococcaceae bacterium]|nr:hypothetical protein [Oscillospiraceae bacterium]
MKRTISFISLALSLLVVLSIFAVAVTVSRGITVNAATSIYDMNGDGSLNINDVLVTLKAVNGKDVQLSQDSDLNSDGEFNIVDVLVLLKRITEAMSNTPTYTNLLKVSEEHASLVQDGAWAGACAGASGGVNANMAAYRSESMLTIDTASPLYGEKVLKIVSSASSVNPQFVLFQNFADLGIERGKTYTFFAKVRGEGFDSTELGAFTALEMQYCDEDVNAKTSSVRDDLTNKAGDAPAWRGATLDGDKFGWTTVKITFTVPTDDASLTVNKSGNDYDCETLRLVLRGYKGEGTTVYFDALGLVEGSYTHDELNSTVIPALSDSFATPTPTITPGDDDEMFPFFNGTNERTISLSSSCKEYTYSDTSAEDFAAYKSLLLEKGYTLVSENSIKDNLFAGFEKDGKLLYAYYTKYDNLTRIIDDPVSPASKLTADSYEKVTETKIAAIAHEYSPVMVNRGMCFVITLEDGRYIVIDSGGNDVTDEGSELFHTRLRRYLNDFNEHPSGKIHIAAWIATHDHYDHTEAMVNYLLTYYEDTTVEYIIANTPSGGRLLPTALGDICELYPYTQVIVPHSGQNFEFCNTKVEILYTQEDFFPAYTPNSSSLNDCSMNFRLYANGQTILIPGDIQQTAAAIISEMYGDYLKSDIVHVAHHGNSEHTATKEYYGFVDPETVLWPFALWSFESWRNGESNVYLLSKLNVKEVIISDITTKVFSLPYTPRNNEITEYVVTADESYPFETGDMTIIDPTLLHYWCESEVPSEIENLLVTDDETATNIVDAAWPGGVSSAAGGFEANIGKWSSGAALSFDETDPLSGNKSLKIVSSSESTNPQFVLFQNFADFGIERGKTYTFFAKVRGENITQKQLDNFLAISVAYTDEYYNATTPDVICLQTGHAADCPNWRGATLIGDKFDWTTVKITFTVPTDDTDLTAYDNERECIAETFKLVLSGCSGEGTTIYFDAIGLVEGAYSHETLNEKIIPALFSDIEITPSVTPIPLPSTPTLLKISEEHASLVQDGAWAGACAGATDGVNANIGAWRSEAILTIDTASPLYGDKTLKIVASDASVNPQFVLFQNFADLGIERGKTYTFFAKVRGEGFDSTELGAFTALEMQYCDEDVNAKTDLITDILTNKTSDAPTRRGATLDGDKFGWTTVKITFTVPTDDASLTVNKNGNDYDCETLRLVLRGYKGEGTTVYFDALGLVEGSYTHNELNSTIIPQFFGEANK